MKYINQTIKDELINKDVKVKIDNKILTGFASGRLCDYPRITVNHIRFEVSWELLYKAVYQNVVIKY